VPSKTPLKVRLTPGEYEGYADLPNGQGGHVRRGGTLSLESESQPMLSLHGNVPLVTETSDGVARTSFPQISRHPTLRVDLATGMEAILLNCTVDVFPGRALVVAVSALVGRPRGSATEASEPLFNRLRMQITDCDAVGSPSPLGSMQFPTTFDPDHPATWSVTERFPRETGASDGSARVSAGWDGSFSIGNGYEHYVSFSPVWEVSLTKPAHLRELLDDWVIPLHRIVGLSTGRPEKITYLELIPADHGDHRMGVQVFGGDITQMPYASDESEVIKTDRAFVCYGADDSPRLLELCRGWQRALKERHPLVETFAAFMFVTRQHPRPRFLLLVQALEGLYGHEQVAERQAREQDHIEKRKQALAAVATCDRIDTNTKRFLKNNLLKRPKSNVEMALKAAIGNLPIDLSAKIEALELVQTVIADADNSASQWSAALGVVRNHLSHGTRGWDPDLLRPAADLLETVARAQLMRTIGVPNRMIESFLTTQLETDAI
jgi:hypothetical protein